MRVAVLLFVVSVSLTEGMFCDSLLSVMADGISANGTYTTPQRKMILRLA